MTSAATPQRQAIDRVDAAAAAVRAAIARHGPGAATADILQPAGLYLELLGEDIRARAFTLTGPDGGEWCLRPDMTAPIVRDVLAAAPAGQAAAAYDGLVFRRQARGSTRETEFRVVGMEVLAPAAFTPEAEADLVATALEAARSAGVTPRLKLGDIALARAVIAAVGLAPAWEARIQRAFARTGAPGAVLGEAEAGARDGDAVGEAIAALPADRAAAVVDALLVRSGAPMVGGRTAADVARRLTAKSDLARADRPHPDQIARIRAALAVEAAPAAAFEQLAGAMPSLGPALETAAARWRALSAHVGAGVEVAFSAGFGRGPAYYDGFVFELEAPALGERAALGGGGRYDDLLRRLAAGDAVHADWRAMGFSLRPLRLADAAEPAR
ncbi:MAG: ATP phosphoribosyltransferase regulatory subunit [Alphaproteobacteria bacterium]|nr:ATP phosphoribosyltransferase regulatory subunit [Alphaproteobacteria bacterium]